MWCSVKAAKSTTLYSIVEDPSRVKVLAVIKKGYTTDSTYYVIEAKWHGCSNPNFRDEKLKVFIDPSIKDFKGEDLIDAYWIEDYCVENTWEAYTNNKQAAKVLSSDY